VVTATSGHLYFQYRTLLEHPGRRLSVVYVLGAPVRRYSYSTGGTVIECVRAVLLTPADGLLLMKHTWPGGTPYWVFPGGHVEPDDASLRAALRREVREETGADLQIVGLLHILADEYQRQHFYLGHIQAWSESDRTGPEFDDPDRGEYRLQEIPLMTEALDAITVEPQDVAALLRDAVTAGTNLVTLADRHDNLNRAARMRAADT
jgi:8-oxo-dGTP pyrophosphatase MutT (NUDIX family)